MTIDIRDFLGRLDRAMKELRGGSGGRSGARFGDSAMARLTRRAEGGDGVLYRGRFDVECYDALGNLKWVDSGMNRVVTEGLQHNLDILFNSSDSNKVPVDPWYVGLTDGTPTTAAGDTLASHVGWVEVTDYTGNRKAYVGTRSAEQMTNSASKASFTINQNSTTIGGAFLGSVDTGSAGTLLCVVAFTGGDKTADDQDTLEVTYTFDAADDGV